MQSAAPVEVRTYRGRSQAVAAERFQLEAEAMAARGLVPTMHLWSPPEQWRTFVTPIALIVAGWLLIGILGAAAGGIIGLLYVMTVRPSGTLTVTYTPVAAPGSAPGMSADGLARGRVASGSAPLVAGFVVPGPVEPRPGGLAFVTPPRPRGRSTPLVIGLGVVAVVLVAGLVFLGAREQGRRITAEIEAIVTATAPPTRAVKPVIPAAAAAVTEVTTSYGDFLLHVHAVLPDIERLFSKVPSKAKAMDGWMRRLHDYARTELAILDGTDPPAACYVEGYEAWHTFWRTVESSSRQWLAGQRAASVAGQERLPGLIRTASGLLEDACAGP